MVPAIPCTQGEIVRPALRRYGVAITNKRVVLFLSKDIYSVKKIEPVGVARKVERQFVSLGKIAVGILSL